MSTTSDRRRRAGTPMTCALYTARADHKTVVLDKNPAVGALAITSHIANYRGGRELAPSCSTRCATRRASTAPTTAAPRCSGSTRWTPARSTFRTPNATRQARARWCWRRARWGGRRRTRAKTFPAQGRVVPRDVDGALYRDREVVVAGLEPGGGGGGAVPDEVCVAAHGHEQGSGRR